VATSSPATTATRLARCLESLRTVCGEVVALDSKSTDGSVELSRNMGARSSPTPGGATVPRGRRHGSAGLWRGGLDALRLSWAVSTYHSAKYRHLRALRQGRFPELRKAFGEGRYGEVFALVREVRTRVS